MLTNRWDDLWLNEGFASWMQTYAAHELFPMLGMWEQFVVADQQSALRLDSLRSSHPIQVHTHRYLAARYPAVPPRPEPSKMTLGVILNPVGYFRTAVPFWGQITRNLTASSPHRDCGPKRVSRPPRDDAMYVRGLISTRGVIF